MGQAPPAGAGGGRAGPAWRGDTAGDGAGRALRRACRLSRQRPRSGVAGDVGRAGAGGGPRRARVVDDVIDAARAAEEPGKQVVELDTRDVRDPERGGRFDRDAVFEEAVVAKAVPGEAGHPGG